MTDFTSKIKEGMARVKISNDYQLAERIGLSRQTLSRKLKSPNSFTPREIQSLAKLFGWNDSELGEYIKLI